MKIERYSAPETVLIYLMNEDTMIAESETPPGGSEGIGGGVDD